jgi:hypothetical protein
MYKVFIDSSASEKKSFRGGRRLDEGQLQVEIITLDKVALNF